jgi:N-acetylneuraminic acid mutarotase
MRKSVAVMLVLVFSSALLIVAANPAGATTTENSWTTMADMPTSRLGPGVAVVNGKIYVIGGTGGGGYLNTNEEYDPATNTWVTKKPMPTPRAGFAIAVYKNKIYCIGGGPGNDWTVGFEEVTRMNEVYDPLTDTWETKTPMPTARKFLCANVVGGKIYLIGGSKPFNPNNPSFVPNVNEVYDPETDKWTTDPPPTTLPRVNTDTGTTSHTWTTKTPPPVNVSNYASAVIDNKIYIISGSGSNNELTLIYETETDSWSYGAQIPTPVWGAAAGVTSGVLAPKRIYVIGGYPAFNQVQIYDPETDTWTTGANMPTNRYGLGVAVVDDILYAIGGAGKKNERYTPVGYGVSDSTSSPSPSQEPTSTPEQQQIEPFPTTLVIASVITVAVVGVSLLAYFKKRQKESGDKA